MKEIENIGGSYFFYLPFLSDEKKKSVEWLYSVELLNDIFPEVLEKAILVHKTDTLYNLVSQSVYISSALCIR